MLPGRAPRAPREPGERGSAGRPPSLPRRVVERILTTFGLDEYVHEALRAGTSGFLLKDAGADELLHAVRVIAAGEAPLSPSITRRLIADYARRPPTREKPAALAELTPR
jgi:DNA-binding NarL/FixJ family response regulator